MSAPDPNPQVVTLTGARSKDGLLSEPVPLDELLRRGEPEIRAMVLAVLREEGVTKGSREGAS